MAPIHDTDIAEKRWSDEEWRQFELWEKIETRIRRRRRLWIAMAMAGFLVLSSVPTAMDRWPKWVSRRVARQVAQEVNRLRSQAILDAKAYRLSFLDAPGLAFRVDSAESCDRFQTAAREEKSGFFLSSRFGRRISNQFKILTPSEGADLGIPVLRSEICFDGIDLMGRLEENSAAPGAVEPSKPDRPDDLKSFAIAVAQTSESAKSRPDHLSVVVLTGPSFEVDFE